MGERVLIRFLMTAVTVVVTLFSEHAIDAHWLVLLSIAAIVSADMIQVLWLDRGIKRVDPRRRRAPPKPHP